MTLEQQQLPTGDQVFKCLVGDISFMPPHRPQKFHQLLGSEICASWVFRVLLLLNQRKLFLDLKKISHYLFLKNVLTPEILFFLSQSPLSENSEILVVFCSVSLLFAQGEEWNSPPLLAQFLFCMLCSTASVLNSFRLKIVFKNHVS